MKRAHEIERPRRGPELAGYYRRLLFEQETSGLSVTEFSREVGVSACTLYLWRRRFEQEEAPTPASRPAGPLVEVLVAEGGRRERGPAAGLALRLESGVRVEVAADFDPAVLRRLLEALEGC